MTGIRSELISKLSYVAYGLSLNLFELAYVRVL